MRACRCAVPATARDVCSDAFTSYDSNLQQTLFALLCFAAVFCRVGTPAFAALGAVTVVNFVAARSAWSAGAAQPFAAGIEVPTLVVTLLIIGAGVRHTDLHLRRDFAAREMMLMLIQEQGQQMEAAEEDAPPRAAPTPAPR